MTLTRRGAPSPYRLTAAALRAFVSPSSWPGHRLPAPDVTQVKTRQLDKDLRDLVTERQR